MGRLRGTVPSDNATGLFSHRGQLGLVGQGSLKSVDCVRLTEGVEGPAIFIVMDEFRPATIVD